MSEYQMDTIVTRKKAMLEALEKSLGVVTDAAALIGMTRNTHYVWMREDPEYKQAVLDIEAVSLDFVESQLFKSIKDGNVTAMIFYLKTKGKKRGYVEQLDLNALNNNKPFIMMVHLDDEAEIVKE